MRMMPGDKKDQSVGILLVRLSLTSVNKLYVQAKNPMTYLITQRAIPAPFAFADRRASSWIQRV